MFKKLVKSTLALALIAGGSAFAMQKPAAYGKIQVGLTPAQTAAQKEQFAKLIQQAETRKAAAKAKAAAAVTPAERTLQQKQVADAEAFARQLRAERDEFERAQAQRPAVPAWPASSTLKPAAAGGYVYNPVTGERLPLVGGYRYISNESAPASLRSSTSSLTSSSGSETDSDDESF